MSGSLRRARDFVEELVRAVLAHGVINLGAQLAYWSILAFFPFVIFVLTVVGYLPLDGLDDQLMSWAQPFMPDSALRLVWDTVHEVLGRQRGGLLTISFLGALWSASGGVSALQAALNKAYGVPETRSYLRRKERSLVVTLAAAVLLVVAVGAAALGGDALRAAARLFNLDGEWGGFLAVWRWARWALSLASLIALLAALYKYLPAVEHGYGLLSLGSLVAVALWLGVTWAFRVFVAAFGTYARTYGALAAVIVLITWIYLSGLAVILGAEVNALIARWAHGQRGTGAPRS